MVKKKTTKKKSVKKKTSKKNVSKSSKSKRFSSKVSVKVSRNKFVIVLRNLFIFLVLTLISYIFKIASGSEVYREFFMLLSWIFGIISIAFLIMLLILVLMKSLKK